MRIRHRWIIILILTFVLSSCSSSLDIDVQNSSDKSKSTDQVKLFVLHNWVGQDGKAIAMRRILDEFRVAHPEVLLVDEGLVTEGMKTRLRISSC